MITHIIYHIPGRKVGCTKNLRMRMWQYKFDEGKVPDYEILEELHDKIDKEAGDIEWKWADRLGYHRGKHYTDKEGWRNLSTAQRKEAGRKGALRSSQVGITYEQRAEWGRQGGREGGLKGILKLTREQKSKGGKKTGGAGIGGCFIKSECSHCGLSSTLVAITRWHNDNCPHKPIGFVRGN
jgi:hypothetical protein